MLYTLWINFIWPSFLLHGVLHSHRDSFIFFIHFSIVISLFLFLLKFFCEFEFFFLLLHLLLLLPIVSLFLGISFIHLIKWWLLFICSCLCCYCWPAIPFLMCLFSVFFTQCKTSKKKIIINEINERKACGT